MTMPAMVGGVAAGAVLGTVYIRLLRANVGLYVRGGGWVRALALHAARLALVAVVLWQAARWGAPVLLGALVGFLAARGVGVRRRSAGP
ncbi:MAG: hypothetical protein M0006_06190 [Magnetospirillum sp.]|nr:hypothetical protein [Magnetospirillum sp.]